MVEVLAFSASTSTQVLTILWSSLLGLLLGLLVGIIIGFMIWGNDA